MEAAFVCPETGTSSTLVAPVDNGAATNCNVNVQAIDLDACGEPHEEPNNLRDEAYPVDFAARSFSMDFPSGDDDWFFIESSGAEEITVTLTSNSRDGDLDLYVSTGPGQVIAESATLQNIEKLTVTPPAGQIWIHPYPFRGESLLCYHLAISRRPLP